MIVRYGENFRGDKVNISSSDGPEMARTGVIVLTLSALLASILPLVSRLSSCTIKNCRNK